MQIYELIRRYRQDDILRAGREYPIARIKAEDYDQAIKIAEHIEVLPGVFGDDVVEPNGPMILMMRDYHAENKRISKNGEV